MSIFLSLSIILLSGSLLYFCFRAIKLPQLIGYLLAGIVIGPYLLNLFDVKLLAISGEIRHIALIIILLRGGLSLNIYDLCKAGRPTILMCFLPAICEILIILFIAPLVFGISYLEALILGSILAAVSPAVIVPRMIELIDNKIGTEKGIPQMLLAGASVDDVLVIILFSSFMSTAKGSSISVMSYLNIPISMIFGALTGIMVGIILAFIFARSNIRAVFKVILLISVSLGLKATELLIEPWVAYSSLLAIMALGITLLTRHPKTANDVNPFLNEIWIIAEMFLFILVGASVNIAYLTKNLGIGILVVICGVIIRMLAVFLCTIKTGFNIKEKLFCAISYTPKATVQAAIGGMPLIAGLACGELVLSVAVISILLTAPLGAIFIDFSHKKLLEQS